MRLTIHHTGRGPEEPLFRLGLGENTADPVPLPDPASWPITGYDGGLMKHLQWYLEDYLNLPEGGNVKRAAVVISALEAWGAAVFDALFDRDTYSWYLPYREHLEELQIRIISKSPTVLAWPWEAICDNRHPGERTGTFLASHCCLERQPDPYIPSVTQPEDTDILRMLLVIARPYGNMDVGYHTLAREVVDYVRDKHLPVEINVLRPPTFENLQKTLNRAKQQGHPYHIVHFDGHGGYGVASGMIGTTGTMQEEKPGAKRERSQKFQGAEGNLIFETVPPPGGEPEPDPKGAKEIGQVLYQCGVSMAVLNACQSAMIDQRADDAYASVAASLLGSGIRSVTAMGYSLYVSGAKHFVPAFYNGLFRNGSPAEAMREGRIAMYIHQERNSMAGRTRLQDWLVPELYQLLPENAKVLPNTRRKSLEIEAQVWPEDALDPEECGFIGRGQAIQELERVLLRRTAAGIVIHGMAGTGKTALTRGFLSWLRDTGGLLDENGVPCWVFWFDFRGIHRGPYIVEELAAHLLDGGASMRPEEKLRRVVKILREQRMFIVWDNFESVSGAPGTVANLSKEDRTYLKTLLEKLDGGKSRVFLTSRMRESWLGEAVTVVKGDLDGLRGDELWEYCGRIAERLNIQISREDAALLKLLEKLDGNPLAIRAILSRLRENSAEKLLKELDQAFHGVEGDKNTIRILAAFRVVCRGANRDMIPILQILGLHERFADTHLVLYILWHMEESTDSDSLETLRESVTRCFELLESAGLCTHIQGPFYRLHPALRGCLTAEYPATKNIRGLFVQGLLHADAEFHDLKTKKTLRNFFFIHEANIYHAKSIAEELDVPEYNLRLLYVLASAAHIRNSFSEAKNLSLELAEKAQQYGDKRWESQAYEMLAALPDDWLHSKKWIEHAIEIKQDVGKDAEYYYSLGLLAVQQNDLKTAMAYFQKSLAKQKATLFLLGESEDSPKNVTLYGLLGTLAGEMGDSVAARKWLLKSYEVAKKHNMTSPQGDAIRMLAMLSAESGDFLEAEHQNLEALKLFEELGDALAITQTRSALGYLYCQTGQYPAAHEEFTEALHVARQINTKEWIALSYEGLGQIAALEGQFKEARDWWEQALEMYEGLNYEERVAGIRKELEALEQAMNGNSEPEDLPSEKLMQLLSEHPEWLGDLMKMLHDKAEEEDHDES